MSGAISVSEESLDRVKVALDDASTEYKTNLTKLSNLITEITNGDIKGAPADDLRTKYEAKISTFNHLREVIDEAEEFMTQEKNKFNSMMTGLKSDMK